MLFLSISMCHDSISVTDPLLNSVQNLKVSFYEEEIILLSLSNFAWI